ncbi:hypothetical protein DKZ29_00845 [Limosilactobacillus reuteri]|uniref:Uncharacterized protein n=1 Tax=Limosilactobacillus reuteri TaxID=1598 RepID=A0A855XQA1_LIMRT|nr:hypothetical protein [Limosilactobacillus reuteri]PWT33236.1 hypothetical protein DKZ21_03920 [Limosilactobacillus reuteri]PWT36084.1 hypothetical protein DKZ24_00345 [Limosilactobacillus reuteri]PWT43130.1 hypothetical protein DKZ22_01930 [Limosilactobacillus reuteri]PWT44770.1 hypothetical protein DKZ25_03920 [Limosilactobacillus reuteri]PWT55970.1 hypothetical protein DKZ31_00345 [Limosilactobacillus reuteri]
MKILVWLAVILTAFLLGAKLAGAVTCSWLVIFAPLLIVFGLWFLIVLFLLAIIGIVDLIALIDE